MENANPNIARVQHVAKSSSDQLLNKFAEVGSDSEEKNSAKKKLRLAKRMKRSQLKAKRFSCGNESNSLNSSGNVLAERKSLLPPAPSGKSLSLIRNLGMGKAKIRSKELKTKSIIAAFEKTWRRTVEGASRVLMEKHYNRHKRLINDLY